MMEIVSRFARLGLQTYTRYLCQTSTMSGCCASAASRWFSSSTALARRLDSHAYPPYKLPSSKHGRWAPRKSFRELYEYTIEPLPNPRTGGRGPNGRIWNHRRGGGLKKCFYMIDHSRLGGTTSTPQGGVLTEKIDKIMKDPNRSAHIALVAGGEHKRYIIATDNMQIGNTVKSSEMLTRSPIRPTEGDSHPLGSLPIGTLVCCVERYPGEGGLLARAAGVTAMLLRRNADSCVLRLPSKHEIEVSSKCFATVGRVSNVDHNKRVLGKAGANRWLGIRPKSGRWHRKTGRFGRKIRALPPVKVCGEKRPAPKPAEGRFSLPSVPGVYQSVRY